MSQPPSFVTQAKRDDKPLTKNGSNQGEKAIVPTNTAKPIQNKIVKEDTDDKGTSGCFCFTAKNNNNNNNNTKKKKNKKNGSTKGPAVSKLNVQSDSNNSSNNNIDRDRMGVNSPRQVAREMAYQESVGSINREKTNALLPKQKPGREGKKCLVLDLDETLIHSSFDPVDRYDFLVPVEIDDNTYEVYVAKRPHVDEFF